MNKERELFLELEKLVQEPGYINAFSYLIFNNNTMLFENSITEDEIANSYNSENALRIELSLILGLMIKGDINLSPIKSEIIQKYYNETISLLELIHKEIIPIDRIKSNRTNSIDKNMLIREAIYYSGETAYSFQYLEFAKARYSDDKKWLLENKGFSIEDAYNVLKEIEVILNEKKVYS